MTATERADRPPIPIPGTDVLDRWKVKNSGTPVDDEAVERFLEETRPGFQARVTAALDRILGPVAESRG